MCSRAKWADEWFYRLAYAYKIVGDNRKDNAKRIKIAILDSGIDGTHKDIKDDLENPKTKRSIRAWQAFPDHFNPLQDITGHGTHGASVLLKTAPHIALYVARITDNNGDICSEHNYDAIVKVL